MNLSLANLTYSLVGYAAYLEKWMPGGSTVFVG
jgi:hypothetical protein